MPCFYYSPNANASAKPKNVPLAEAELGSHVLRMFPSIQWHDQYNLNEKGMMKMYLHLLLTSLQAMECLCTHKRAYCMFDLNLLLGPWKSKFLLKSYWDYWREGQKNKKSHLWHGLMIIIGWDK